MIYILDLESNGLTFSDIEITQVAYLKLNDDLEIEKEFNRYFYCNNLKDSAEVTGLDYNKLASLSNGETMKVEDLQELLDEIEHGVIVGQNINYDIMVLDSLSIKHGLGLTPKYPLEIINQFSPKGNKMNLSWIVNNHITEEGKALIKERFKDGEGFHDALYDIYSVYALIKYSDEFKKRLNNYLKTIPRG